jgi:hypothetical protein
LHARHTGIDTGVARLKAESQSSVRPIASALQHTQRRPKFGATKVASLRSHGATSTNRIRCFTLEPYHSADRLALVDRAAEVTFTVRVHLWAHEARPGDSVAESSLDRIQYRT